MKAFLTLIAVFLFSLAIFGDSPGDSPEVIISTSHTIVFKEKDGEAMCTAVSIAPRAYLTAAHCVGSNIAEIDGTTVIVVKVIKDRFDHAILLVRGKPTPSLAKFSAVVARPGDDVYVVGNPEGFHNFVRKGVVAGYESKQIETGEHLVMFFDINGTVGDSGAGVFNLRGDLITVLSAVWIQDNFSLMIALPLHFTPEQIKEARDFE